MLEKIGRQELLDYIYYFLNDEDPEKRVMMITGDWGVGKTYLVKDLIESDTLKCFKYKTISLFGIDTIKSLKNEFVLKTNGWFKFNQAIKRIAKAFNIRIGNSSGTFGLDLSISDLISAVENGNVKDKENLVLIIDDVERKNKKISIFDVLDFIDELKLLNIHIILICNERGLLDESKDKEYIAKKEKVIASSFDLSQPTPEALCAVFNNNKILERCAKELNCTNLRVCKRFVNILKDCNIPMNDESLIKYYKLILSCLMNIHTNLFEKQYYINSCYEEKKTILSMTSDSKFDENKEYESIQKQANDLVSETNFFVENCDYILGYEHIGAKRVAKYIYDRIQNGFAIHLEEMKEKSLISTDSSILDWGEIYYSDDPEKTLNNQIVSALCSTKKDIYIDADIYKSIIILNRMIGQLIDTMSNETKQKMNELKQIAFNGAYSSLVADDFNLDMLHFQYCPSDEAAKERFDKDFIDFLDESKNKFLSDERSLTDTIEEYKILVVSNNLIKRKLENVKFVNKLENNIQQISNAVIDRIIKVLNEGFSKDVDYLVVDFIHFIKENKISLNGTIKNRLNGFYDSLSYNLKIRFQRLWFYCNSTD